MATVMFTANLRRHVACPGECVDGRTVREVLDSYFVMHPAVRSYVLDETGAVRKHVVVFVHGTQLVDVISLSDHVGPDAEIHIMQALSGG